MNKCLSKDYCGEFWNSMNERMGVKSMTEHDFERIKGLSSLR